MIHVAMCHEPHTPPTHTPLHPYFVAPLCPCLPYLPYPLPEADTEVAGGLGLLGARSHQLTPASLPHRFQTCEREYD